MLYPIALPDRLELLVSFGDEQRQFTASIPEASLRDEVQRFRELLEKRTTNEYLVPARQLYDQIIRPMEQVLAQMAPYGAAKSWPPTSQTLNGWRT